jgi:hypothetical protein
MKFKLPPIVKTYLGKLKPIAKHHYFIVMVILFGGVSGAIYLVNETLNQPTDAEYYDQQMHATIGSKFNQNTKTTIEKIKSLQKASDPNNAQTPLPSGRINPFAE